MNSQFTAMRAVFIKDVRLLWPFILLCTSLFLARALLPGESGQLAGTLSTIANLILIVAVIHLDAPSSLHLDWLTRPIAPTALLAEKLAFLLIALLLPSMAGGLVHGLAMDIPPAMILPSSSTAVFMTLVPALPVMAAAALTTRLISTAVLFLGAAAVNAVVLSVALPFMGHAADSMDEEAIQHMTHTLAILAIAGSTLVLWLQYVPRRTRAARVAFGGTALMAILVQIGFASSL
ncbi:hypothetical protein [Niveispirillum sp. KHB5.9]|uniref:hypothetical protein n=1 Tax=Niveispirillum sp. KHB5.9 TaxID=3400269 RepID=UPI003A8997B3